MEAQYNTRSPAVKRLMREAHEMSEPTADYFAQPLEDNLFEWHFTVRGPSDSDFEGGVYHGRIVLPSEYPMKPPNIIVLTPNGRFEVGKKICLSISQHHPESWQPSWSIRTALLAIIGFMPTPGNGSVGSLDYPAEERKSLAAKSQSYSCDRCGLTSLLLKPRNATSQQMIEETAEIVKDLAFKGEEEIEDKEKAERRRLSLQAQNRFREKIRARTGVEIRGTNNPITNVPLVQQTNSMPNQRERQRYERREDQSWSLADYLILALVLGIVVILCRRLFYPGSVSTTGNGSDEL